MKEKILLLSILLIASFMRLYSIDKNPPGLYIDEVAIGYNAYSILKTGKDEYGEQYPLLFKSYGDYKLPGYIYVTSFSMALFGKNEFAIRFPSAFAGIITVLLFYFFLRELFDREKHAIQLRWIPLMASFLLAFSPWHIQFSRGGFEANLALLFFIIGSYLSLMFLKKKNVFFLFMSFFFYSLTLYTYQSYRITALISVFVISCYFFITLPQFRKHLLGCILFFFIMSLPIISITFTQNGAARFTQTSSFIEYTAPRLIDKIIIYPFVFLKNYVSFFSINFLFSFGDGIGRHQLPGFGVLYRWQLPFVLIGFLYILKNLKYLSSKIVLLLLIITPIAASFARPSPHSLRTLLFVIPLMILISIGISVFLKLKFNYKKILIVVIYIGALYEFAYYIHLYTIHYPKVNLLDWGAGYKEVVLESQKYKGYTIIVDENLNMNPMYFKFFGNSSSIPEYVNVRWTKPESLKSKKVLYIRPYYRNENNIKLLKNIRFNNANNDIFAQFIEL